MSPTSTRDSVVAIALAVLLFLLLLGGGAFLIVRAKGTGSDRSVETVAAPTLPPIKVGVVLSEFTSRSWGWKLITKVANEGLFDKSFEAYAIVEPGTGQSGEIPDLCRKYFNGRPPIDCTDDARLRELDVIAAPYISHLTPEMANAIEKLVRDQGKGLMIRAWLGRSSPGFTPQVLALNGLKEGQFGWNPQDTNCQVIAPHPILGDLSGQIGAQLLLEPNGSYGTLDDGQPLVRVTDMSKVSPEGANVVTNRPDWVHAPLYVARFGKGTIVGCMIHGHKNDDFQTSNFVHTIMPRSIQWLAGRLP